MHPKENGINRFHEKLNLLSIEHEINPYQGIANANYYASLDKSLSRNYRSYREAFVALLTDHGICPEDIQDIMDKLWHEAKEAGKNEYKRLVGLKSSHHIALTESVYAAWRSFKQKTRQTAIQWNSKDSG